MFINEIKIMHRRNLGNYEHREATLGMALTEDDNIEEAKKVINSQLKSILYPEAAPAVTKEAVEKMAEETPAKVPAKKAPVKKAPAKKAPVKKAPAKKAEVVPTMEEMMVLCRETATRLKSGEKVKALIEKACGVASLKEADEKTFLALQKLLKAAK